MKRLSFVLFSLLQLALSGVFAADERPGTTATTADTAQSAAEVVDAAKQAAEAFLSRLSEARQRQVLFAFDDEEQRRNWSNLPTGIYTRAGLRWGDLNDQQQEALTVLLQRLLSEEGVRQIFDNMDGDETLVRPGGQRGRTVFGRDEYYASFLGDPRSEDRWMLQFGGHHLGINVTVVGSHLTIAPSLTGGQPIDFQRDGKPVRQLADEEDASYEFIAALTPRQLEKALLDQKYVDMEFGPGKEDAVPRKEGINCGELTAEQKSLLMSLIATRMNIMKPVFAKARLKRIEADLNDTWFAWYGPIEEGGAATFRIQGPTILMEYAPQQLGGIPTNHIHAMYRDPTNDYGRAWRAGN